MTPEQLLHGERFGNIWFPGYLPREIRDALKIGPNLVHVVQWHHPGCGHGARVLEPEDHGVSVNLVTNGGKDLIAAALGHSTMKDGAVTASSSTSATPSGGGMTTDQYKGWRVFMPVTGLTTAPVYGNIGTNSATVLTIDQWWTAADGVGTTPASTSGYSITPTTAFRFMGITADAGAAAAGDTTLTSEQTANGLARALATYAHTGGTSTFTLAKTFSVTGTVASLHKIGLFTALNTTAGGIMGFEVVMNSDASVVNGDSLAVTWTGTLS